MRQNTIHNNQEIITMEEYLEKRRRIRMTEEKRERKTVCGQSEWSTVAELAELYI